MKQRLFALLLLCFCLSVGLFAQRKGEITAKRNVIDGGYNFWFYTPEEYEAGGHPLPVVLFLHGASLCGNNLDRVRRYGTLDALEKGKIIPAYVVAPQNRGGAWNPRKLHDVIDWVKAHYPVDDTRIYVLGMSLGGYGTLDYTATYPGEVAAAMALCGGSTLKDVQPLGEVPLWIMHGTADRAVNANESKKIVKALQQSDHARLLRFDWVKGGSHGLLARLFYMQKTYDWLFSHSLKDHPRTVDRTFDIGKSDFDATYRELRMMSECYDEN